MKWLDTQLKTQKFVTSKDFYNQFGFNNVVGVSHAGFKAMAGPLYVAAVILPPDHGIERLDKIKIIGDTELEKLADEIWDKASYVRTGIISNLDIINRGKKEAIQLALIEALLPFSSYNPVSCIIIDTLEMNPIRNQFKGIPVFNYSRIYDRIDCISAARVIAKQSHDSFMKRAHLLYPQFGWDKNSGYATGEHIEAINTHGWSIFHRIPKT